MDSYYLKLRGFLKPTVLRLGVQEKRWREKVTGDAIKASSGFDYYLPEGDAAAQSIEIYGEKLVLVAEPDRKRADSLFVSRIYPRSPPDPPLLHSTAGLSLLTGPNAKVLSPVTRLFALPASVLARGGARLAEAPWLGELEGLDDESLKLALARHSRELRGLCDGGELEAGAWDALGRLLVPRAAFADVLEGALATDRPMRAVAEWANCLRPASSASAPLASLAPRVIEPAPSAPSPGAVGASEVESQPQPPTTTAESSAMGGGVSQETALATLPGDTRPVLVTRSNETGFGRILALGTPLIEAGLPRLWEATSNVREALKAAPQELWTRARRGVRAARLHPPALIAWPEGVCADYVARHAVGVQGLTETIVERLRCGRSSLAVTAPGRSGKSTLAAHLARLDWCPGLAFGTLVSGAELDTAHRDVGEVFVESLAASLAHRFGLPLAAPGRSSELGAVFAEARASAGRAGAECLVVVVDDADCLFADASTRVALQRSFRRAIDSELTGSRAGCAAAALVLIGSESLLGNMGAELVERLRPLHGGALASAEVARLVRGVTRGLWAIDAESAEMLARLAENVSFLRDWLEAASRAATLRGGHTVTVDDVLEAERQMVRELREGRASALEQRLLHSLASRCGGSVDLGAARLAVAAAWAKGRADGASTDVELLEGTVACLTAWAADACGDSLQRLAYEPDSVAIHVRELRERGLLGAADFTSELRRAHLLRVATRPPLDDEWFQSGLRAVGAQQVVPPALLEPIALGDSAKVFRFSAGDERLAYREVRRASGLTRPEFEARLGALRVVQHASRARAPGSEYVFDLRAVGLRFDDTDVAVQIYRWVDGEDLGSRVGGLAVAAATQIARCLARALDWLHGLGVLVFELRPEHVILEARHAHPVIIDLGLARLDASAALPLSSPLPAAAWSKADDVAALGGLLQSLLIPTDSRGELAEILERMGACEREARPSAAELTQLFDAMYARTLLEQASRDSFRRDVLDVARRDFHHAYYRDVVQKFGPSFEASWLGLYPTALQRATRAADFLNQLLEAWSSERFGNAGRVALGNVKRNNHATGGRLAVPEIGALHLLRTYRSHGGRGTLAEQVKARYSQTTLADLRRLTLRGAELIGEELRLESLSQVVAAFFDTGGHGRE